MTEQAIVKTDKYAHLKGLVLCGVDAKAIFGLLSEGVVVVDHSGRIVLVNRRVKEIFGYGVDEMLGRPLDILLPEKFHRSHALAIESFFKNPRARSMGHGRDLVAKRKNGETFPVEVGLCAFNVGHCELSIAIVADISVRKKMEMELLKARNAELDAFAHTVAHDLSGALTPIVGLSESLADSYETLSPQEIKNDLLSIAKAGLKMGDIIKSLLLFASIRKEDVVVSELDMGAIVKEVLHRLHYVIQEREAEVVVPEHFPRALGVAAWVEEVWYNYISNGLKYGGNPPRLVLGASLRKQARLGSGFRTMVPVFRRKNSPKSSLHFTKSMGLLWQGTGSDCLSCNASWISWMVRSMRRASPVVAAHSASRLRLRDTRPMRSRGREGVR